MTKHSGMMKTGVCNEEVHVFSFLFSHKEKGIVTIACKLDEFQIERRWIKELHKGNNNEKSIVERHSTQ